MVDLSKFSSEELEAMLGNAEQDSAPAAAKPVSEWTTEELSAALAKPPTARVTVRPQRESGETLRPSFEAVGGTLGTLAGGGMLGVAGLLGGPAAPATVPVGSALGAVAGGALGTAAGGYAYDLYRDVKRKFTEDESIPPTTGERLLDPLKSGAIDLAVGGTIAGLPAVTAAGRALKRNALGVTPASADLVAEAERRGIHLGTSDVVEKTPVKTFTGTVGRMPFIGGPMKRAQALKQEEVGKAWENELGAFGPSRTADDLSSELLAKGEHAFTGFRTAAKNRYDAARRLAEAEGPVIPSDSIRRAAADAEFEMQAPRPTLAGGETMSSVTPDYIKKFVEEAQQLGPKLSVRELDWVTSNISTLMEKAKKDGFQWKQANDIRRAAEEALRRMAPSSPATRALLEADDFFSRGMKTFETPTGQRFGRVDKNLFKLGFEKPGTLNQDELVNVVLNSKSPKALADLEALVGRDSMGGLSRRYLESAYKNALVPNEKGALSFDTGKFASTLKLNDPNSAEYKSLAHMYAANGGDVKDLKKLVDITQKIFGNEVPDVSTFVARRAMLGGAKSGLLAVLPGFGAAAGHIAAGGSGLLGLPVLTGTLLARHGIKVFSEPKYLKRMLRTFDPKLPDQVKWINLGRLVRELGHDEATGAAEAGASPGLPRASSAVENALVGP